MPSETPRPPLIYVCSNDGSDTRINKEVKTLTKAFEVHYLGIGSHGGTSFVENICASFSLVPGSAWSFKSILRLIGSIVRKRWELAPRQISIHVVNEQLLAATWPAYFGQRVVLDIFDSIFLRLNKPNNKLWIIKWLLYSIASRVVVTDSYRQGLLASFVQRRSVVIPNVPFASTSSSVSKRQNHALTLAYFGTLAEDRGTALVRKLIEVDPNIVVLCAGWPADETSRQLMSHPAVRNLGVLTQADANEVIAREADYLVAIYPQGNLNNYYASPNKLYDAIHTRTPLIINDNVKVAEFVKENNLGIVVEPALMADPAALASRLLLKRMAFEIDAKLIDRYCWESYEETLITLHRN